MTLTLRAVVIAATSAITCCALASCGSDDKPDASQTQSQSTAPTTAATPSDSMSSGSSAAPTASMTTGGSAAPTSGAPSKPANGTPTGGGSDGGGSADKPKAKPVPPVTTTGKPQLGPTKAVERKTAAPVPVDKEQDFGTGVKAKISNVEAIEVTKVNPGEIKGPAAKFTVTFTNNSDKKIDLTATTVTLNYDGMEASAFSSDPAQEPPASLEPGKSASGVYVFGVPKDKRDKITIRVSYDAQAPLAIFEGKLK